MERGFKSTNELIGAYIASRWNGMSDFYKVTKATPKTIELTEVQWEDDDDAKPEDPTWKACKLRFRDHKPVFALKSCSAAQLEDKDRLKTVKKHVKFTSDGDVCISHIGWDNQDDVFIIAMDDEEAENYKFKQYWN